jgi:hypothetical protein
MCTRRKSIDLPSVPDVYLEKTIDLPSVSDVYPEKNTDLPTKYSKYSCIEYTAPWEGFVKFISCLPMVDGSLRVLPPLKLK